MRVMRAGERDETTPLGRANFELRKLPENAPTPNIMTPVFVRVGRTLCWAAFLSSI